MLSERGQTKKGYVLYDSISMTFWSGKTEGIRNHINSYQELELGDGVKWGQEEHFWMLELYCILIVVVITQLSIFTKLIELYN